MSVLHVSPHTGKCRYVSSYTHCPPCS